MDIVFASLLHVLLALKLQTCRTRPSSIRADITFFHSNRYKKKEAGSCLSTRNCPRGGREVQAQTGLEFTPPRLSVIADSGRQSYMLGSRSCQPLQRPLASPIQHAMSTTSHRTSRGQPPFKMWKVDLSEKGIHRSVCFYNDEITPRGSGGSSGLRVRSAIPLWCHFACTNPQ